MNALTIIKHRKAIYAALGAIEINTVKEDYDIAIERAYDIIRSLEALQLEGIDMYEINTSII